LRLNPANEKSAMTALREQDYQTMLGCIAQLQECGGLEQFQRVALTEISGLVGCDHITFNYVAPTIPKVTVLGHPDLTGSHHVEREREFAKYLSDQPILRNYLATGDPSAHMFSDFLSMREYHRLPLYQHLYHDLRYEDQLAFMLFPPGAEMIAIALARDRRNFTERDRRMLNLLRPHVATAYRQVEKLARLERTLRQGDLAQPNARVTRVVLDEQNRPIQFGSEARRWLTRFFPSPRGSPTRLPDAVTEWLAHPANGCKSNAAPVRRDVALVRERDGQRLRLNLFPAVTGEVRTLVLELETVPAAAHAALDGKLTRREIEVLLEVEQGKTNDEAAVALGISPLTVRTHLEHIFEKLRVPSRTGAVTQFRRLNRAF